jgi:Ala-tRNA(Pro) deacylase
VPGRELAKVVIVRAGEDFVMAVLPATHKLDVARFARATGLREPRLATEDEFARLFPDCDPGARPPFGNLWNLPVWVDDERLRRTTPPSRRSGPAPRRR